MDMPRYPHHCPHCVFLGQHDDNDLYWCAGHFDTTGSPMPVEKNPRICIRCWEDSGSVRKCNVYYWAGRNFPSSPSYRAALTIACRAGLVSKVDADDALAGVPMEDDSDGG